jgi:hypothetical protein
MKPDKEQIAINAARKKGKMSRPKMKKQKVPETPQKEGKQATLDTVIEEKQKVRKKVNADN